MDAVTNAPPTLEEIRTWPAVIGVEQAAAALSLSRSWAYQLVAQNEWPTRVIRIGNRSKIVTSSLISLLETGVA